eukprot:TRINITY_DN679_c0_g1_i4.p1 TRINITY_DN679_c0_g1~~TRINITY_DN679_c0_g1_i4.p1  ORF type:complete len:281 (-),score=98.14 TRINITY_DN679_c0_g1_i4:17-859(-)
MKIIDEQLAINNKPAEAQKKIMEWIAAHQLKLQTIEATLKEAQHNLLVATKTAEEERIAHQQKRNNLEAALEKERIAHQQKLNSVETVLEEERIAHQQKLDSLEAALEETQLELRVAKKTTEGNTAKMQATLQEQAQQILDFKQQALKEVEEQSKHMEKMLESAKQVYSKLPEATSSSSSPNLAAEFEKLRKSIEDNRESVKVSSSTIKNLVIGSKTFIHNNIIHNSPPTIITEKKSDQTTSPPPTPTPTLNPAETRKAPSQVPEDDPVCCGACKINQDH